jgi:hypothetical protein
MPHRLIQSCTLLFAFFLFGSSQQSQADLIDNFDSENGGVGALFYTGFANWNVTAGSVDLIGNGLADFYPGNGLYVDLNGSSAGTLTSKTVFTPGTYDISFSIGNNAGFSGTNTNTMTLSLGSFQETFSEAGVQPLQTVSREITLATSSQLVFASPSSDTDNFGVVIDNVSVHAVSAAVPEPSGLVRLFTGLIVVAPAGWWWSHRTRDGRLASQCSGRIEPHGERAAG